MPESQRVAVGTSFGLEATVIVGRPARPSEDQLLEARRDALVSAIGVLGVELAKVEAEIAARETHVEGDGHGGAREALHAGEVGEGADRDGPLPNEAVAGRQADPDRGAPGA